MPQDSDVEAAPPNSTTSYQRSALTLHIRCLAAVFWRNKLLLDQTRIKAERFVTLRLSLVEAYFNMRQAFSICAGGTDEFYASPALDVAVLGVC